MLLNTEGSHHSWSYVRGRLTASLLATRTLGSLRLRLPACLLHAVLRVLLCPPASPLLFANYARAPEAMCRLELFRLVEVVVDEPEARAAPAAEGRLEAEKVDALRVVHLVHRGELRREVLLGDVGAAGVHDVADELLPPEQRVVLELARPDREVGHGSEPRIFRGRGRAGADPEAEVA